MTDIRNVIIIGATGNLGPAVLKAFLDADKYNVSVLSRQESTATFPSNVKVFKTDYSKSSLEKAFANQDVVVSVIAGGALDVQKLIIDVAAASGVKRFFPSEFGSDTEDKELVNKVPFLQPKVQTLEYLKQKAQQVPGFTYTVLINGLFLDWGLTSGFLGFDAKKKVYKIYDSGDQQFTTSTLATVGRSTVATIAPENYDATANKAVVVSSFVTTSNKLHAALEKHLNEKIPMNHVNSEQSYAAARDKFDGGDAREIFELLTATLFKDGGKGDLSATKGGLWNERLRLPTEEFEEEIAKALKA